MKKALVLLLFIVAIAGLASCKAADKPARVGSKAPDFTLTDLSGNKVRLSDLKGNVVLVNFWATWCPPCRSEIPSMAKLNEAMQGKPFRLLAISIDEGGKEAVEGLFRQMGVSLPTLLDPKNEIGKKYGTTGVPETFIVDGTGTVVKKVIGAMDWSDPQVTAFLTQLMR